MIIKSVPEDAPAVPAAVNGRIMHCDPRIEAILLNLKPGEEIPFHRNPFDVLFAGIEGEALIDTPSGQLTISPGETIFVTSEVERAWKNTGKNEARIMVLKILK